MDTWWPSARIIAAILRCPCADSGVIFSRWSHLDAAEAHLARQLETDQARARESARLTMTDDGQGRTHGRFTLPTLHARMLHNHLLALAFPRRAAGQDTTDRRPLPQLGHAFMEYVERYPADVTPDSGGSRPPWSSR